MLKPEKAVFLLRISKDAVRTLAILGGILYNKL